MSIVFIATGVSAMGAAALTVGALALRERLTARARKAADKPKLSPIERYAGEHVAFAELSYGASISDTAPAGTAFNTLKFDDPQRQVAEYGALQTRLTQSACVKAELFNTAIAHSGGESDDA